MHLNKDKIKNNKLISLMMLCVSFCAFTFMNGPETPEKLKDALSGKFLIGTALNTAQFTEKDMASVRVIKENFNSVVAENCMKPGPAFRLLLEIVQKGLISEDEINENSGVIFWSQLPYV